MKVLKLIPSYTRLHQAEADTNTSSTLEVPRSRVSAASTTTTRESSKAPRPTSLEQFARLREPIPASPRSIDLKITRGLLFPADSGEVEQDSSVSKQNYKDEGSQDGTADQGSSIVTMHRRMKSNASRSGSSEAQAPAVATGTRKSWSSVSGRIFADSEVPSERDRSAFVEEYNALGRACGLSPIPPSLNSTEATEHDRDEAAVAATASVASRTTPRSWLHRKFIRRSPPTSHIGTPPVIEKTVSRRVSFGDVISLKSRRRDSLKDRDLDDIARLGGSSVLVLPSEFAPCSLTIPTCLSATATFLARHGPLTPGIFRVPGSAASINTLYDHYGQQYDDAEKEKNLIYQTIGSGMLPPQIQCGVHDVASVFKKFLSGVPGGILGSVELFSMLRDIRARLFASTDRNEINVQKLGQRLIALAIASSGAEIRVSLICSVVGLACLVGQKGQARSSGEFDCRASSGSDMMNYRGLSIVFAPLLLANLTEQIPSEAQDKRLSMSEVPSTPLKQTKKAKAAREATKKKLAQDCNFAEHLERANIGVEVTQMLIENWPEVVQQMRDIRVFGDSHGADMDVCRPTRSKSLKTLRPSGDSSSHSHNSSLDTAIQVKKQRSRDRSGGTAFFSVRQVTDGRRASMGRESSLKEGNHEPDAEKEMLSKEGLSNTETPVADAAIIAEATAPESSAQPCTGTKDPKQIAPEAQVAVSQGSRRPSSTLGAIESSIGKRRGHKRSKTSPEVHPRADETSHAMMSMDEERGNPSQITHRPIPPAQLAAIENKSTAAVAIQAEHGRGSLEPSTRLTPHETALSQKENVPPGVQDKDLQEPHAPTHFSRIRHTFEAWPGPAIESTNVENRKSPAKHGKRRLFSKSSHRRFNSSLSNHVSKQDTTIFPEARVLAHSSPNRPHPSVTHQESPSGGRLTKIKPPRQSLDAGPATPTSRAGHELRTKPSGGLGNTALYAEICRLQRHLDITTDDLQKTRHKLEAATQLKDSMTGLGEQLRQAIKEVRMWRNRAEWAEKRLLTHLDIGRVGKLSTTSAHKHQHGQQQHDSHQQREGPFLARDLIKEEEGLKRITVG